MFQGYVEKYLEHGFINGVKFHATLKGLGPCPSTYKWFFGPTFVEVKQQKKP